MAEENQQNQQNEISMESFSEEQRAWIENQINSNADRRVNQAQQKWQKEAQRKQSLSGLDEDARQKAEFEQKLADLEAENSALKVTQRKAEVKSVLANHGIDASLGDFLNISEDADENQKTINAIEKIIKNMVAKEVKNRLPSSNLGAGGSGNPLTKEEFAKLPIREQMRIYNTDRQLYDKLTN